MDKKYDELASYYCFDRKKLSMEEFFGDLSAFCKDFEVSWFHQRLGETYK